MFSIACSKKQHVQRQLALAATLGAGGAWSNAVAAAQQAHAATVLAEVLRLGIIKQSRLWLTLSALAIVWMHVWNWCRAWCGLGFRRSAAGSWWHDF